MARSTCAEDVDVVDETAMTVALDAEIRRGLCLCFPPDVAVFSRTRAWHGSLPAFSVVLRQGGAVAAHVGVVDRTIGVGDASLRIAGVQNVFVLPGCRGQGLSRRAMEAAMGEAAHRGMDCGLLFCVPALARVYAAAGWRNLGERPAVRIDGGVETPLPAKNVALYHPLRVSAFPEGPIHLRGNDW